MIFASLILPLAKSSSPSNSKVRNADGRRWGADPVNYPPCCQKKDDTSREGSVTLDHMGLLRNTVILVAITAKRIWSIFLAGKQSYPNLSSCGWYASQPASGWECLKAGTEAETPEPI